ncbi:MAG: hypothetical protein IKN17_01090 [Ruminococcus sp.]|nr:hypothetical protein [Ruminococcus sp.]
MKMKRILAGVSALAAAAAMSVTVFAQAEETETIIRPIGGDPFITDPDHNGTADTAVLFSTEPGYVVTIPKTVVLSGNRNTTYTGSAQIEASEVFLDNNQAVMVKINNAADFTLTSATGNDLGYTVKVGSSEEAVEAGRPVAIFTNNSTAPAVLNFETVSAPQYAGDYSDTLTFDISVAVSN